MVSCMTAAVMLLDSVMQHQDAGVSITRPSLSVGICDRLGFDTARQRYWIDQAPFQSIMQCAAGTVLHSQDYDYSGAASLHSRRYYQ